METEEHAQGRRQARLKARIALEQAITKGVSPESLKDLVDSIKRPKGKVARYDGDPDWSHDIYR